MISVHFGLSIVVKAKELELTQDEARAYAESVAMVARHYDVGASAKTLDWFNLLTTMGSIYGLRVMMIAERRRRERSGETSDVYENGHDPNPHAESDGGAGPGIDWSLMRGGRPN